MRFVKRLIILSGDGGKGTLGIEKNAYGTNVKLSLYGTPLLDGFVVLRIDGSFFSRALEGSRGSFALEGVESLDVVHAAVFGKNELAMYGTNDPHRLSREGAESFKKHIKRSSVESQFGHAGKSNAESQNLRADDNRADLSYEREGGNKADSTNRRNPSSYGRGGNNADIAHGHLGNSQKESLYGRESSGNAESQYGQAKQGDAKPLLAREMQGRFGFNPQGAEREIDGLYQEDGQARTAELYSRGMEYLSDSPLVDGYSSVGRYIPRHGKSEYQDEQIAEENYYSGIGSYSQYAESAATNPPLTPFERVEGHCCEEETEEEFEAVEDDEDEYGLEDFDELDELDDDDDEDEEDLNEDCDDEMDEWQDENDEEDLDEWQDSRDAESCDEGINGEELVEREGNNKYIKRVIPSRPKLVAPSQSNSKECADSRPSPSDMAYRFVMSKVETAHRCDDDSRVGLRQGEIRQGGQDAIGQIEFQQKELRQKESQQRELSHKDLSQEELRHTESHQRELRHKEASPESHQRELHHKEASPKPHQRELRHKEASPKPYQEKFGRRELRRAEREFDGRARATTENSESRVHNRGGFNFGRFEDNGIKREEKRSLRPPIETDHTEIGFKANERTYGTEIKKESGRERLGDIKSRHGHERVYADKNESNGKSDATKNGFMGERSDGSRNETNSEERARDRHIKARQGFGERSGDITARQGFGERSGDITARQGFGERAGVNRNETKNEERAHGVTKDPHIKARQGTFFEQNGEEIERLFSGNRETELEQLLPGSKWARIDYDVSRYYVIGLIGKEFLCYGVPAIYTPVPPEELKGYCWWLPTKPDQPQGKGYWIMYQSLASGESVLPAGEDSD